MTKIEKIRASCSIEWAWRLLNLPGKPGRNCHSPFRKDLKPSFSVYEGKDGASRFFDHATNQKGDICDFAALAWDISPEQAIEKLSAMLGDAEPPQAKFTASAAKLEFPDPWRPPTEDECWGLSILRGLPADTFHTAGLLGTCRVGRHPRTNEFLWWITDPSGHGAEGRTFDGTPCRASGKKSAALPGSKKDWGYGLVTANPWLNDVKNILVVEGGPDYFAAVALATASEVNFRPVAMLGVGCSFGEECREHVRGCTALIVGHNDEEGGKAVERWVDQLAGLGARVLTQKIPTGKDLNEFLVNPGNEKPLDLLKGFSHG